MLDYAYMQSDEPGMTRAPGEQLDHDVYGAAIDKAWEITGNASPGTRAGGDVWQPSATISYNSDVPGEATMKLKNVFIQVHTFFNTGEGYTNANGTVTIPKGRGGRFKNAVQYKICWSTDKWKIHDGFGKSKHKGPKQKSPWSLTIGGDGSSHDATCATIHRALNAYYNESYPKTAGLAKYGNVNVKELHNQQGQGLGSHGNFWYNRYNEIHIYGNGVLNVPYTASNILATTFHELGHASDYAYSGNMADGHDDVQETWAIGVSYAYMSSLYPNNYIEVIGGKNSIIESLMSQGLSLNQLQAIFTTKATLTDCITPLTNLGIPAALINSIFSYKNRPYRINLTDPITGQDNPALNTQVSYSIPAIIPINLSNYEGNAPSVTSFDGWSVSGGTSNVNWQVSGNMSSNPLSITFKTHGSYTLTANFTLAGNVPYSASKTINVTAPLVTPVISGSMFGNLCRFTVTNPQNDVTYEWEVDGTLTALTGPQITVIPNGEIITPYATPPLVPSKRARCRAPRDQVTTAWSNMALVTF